MLHSRSILLRVSILLTVTVISAQHYESDYSSDHGSAQDHGNVQDHGSAEDHGSYNEASHAAHGGHSGHSGHDHPDYTKFFTSDTSAPIVSSGSPSHASNEGHSSGYVAPIDFSTFTGPTNFEFGASSKQEIAKPKNPFAEEEKPAFVPKDDFHSGLPQFAESAHGTTDYFEEAQKKHQPEKEEPDYESGTGYHPHGTATEVDDLTEKLPRQKTYKSYKKFKDNKKPYLKKKPYNGPDYYKEKLVDYHLGKSSSISQQPNAAGYYPKFSQNPAQLSPYQKFSFQPVNDNQGLRSSYYPQTTIAPFNPSYSKISPVVYEYQPSENIEVSIKAGHCKKVNKEIDAKDLRSGRYRRQAMNCYVCEDPNTKAQYEKCSTTIPLNNKKKRENDDQPYKYTSYTDDPFYRSKRYSKKDKKGYKDDPYEYVKSQSQHSYTKPEDYDAEKKSYSDEDYKYNPDDYGSEKSSSEIQAEKLKKSGAECKKVEKEGMTCTVCSSKTGGNYEQCSYTSKPSEQKYAYVRERKYDGSTPAPEKEAESTQPKETQHKSEALTKEEKPTEKDYDKEEISYGQKKPNAESDKHEDKHEYDSYIFPDYYSDSTSKKKKKNKSDGDEDKSENKKSDYFSGLDDYHYKYFPEFSKEETKVDETYINPSAPGSKKDVEDVLAEFAKKDRSKCAKKHKNGMTCYSCLDENGMQHEECMYISESKPSEKNVKIPQQTRRVPVARGPIVQAATLKPSTTVLRAVAIPDTAVAASEEHETKVKYDPEKEATSEVKMFEKERLPSKKKSKKYTESLDEDEDEVEEESKPEKQSYTKEEGEEPKQETPTEFAVGDEEGAFSAETKPAYSKTLGFTLPKYMVSKSEFEEIFDEFVGSG